MTTQHSGVTNRQRLSNRAKPGRPRLDHNPDFHRRFASILPGPRAGTIGKGKAARRLGISHRSLVRYLKTYVQRAKQSAQIHQGE